MDGRPQTLYRVVDDTARVDDDASIKDRWLEYLRGVATERLGRHSEAARRWLRLYPDGRALSFAAQRLVANGQPELAVTYLETLVSTRPDSQAARAALAEALYRSARYDDALVQYEIALRMPRTISSAVLADALYHCASLVKVKGRITNAIEMLQAAVTVYPNYPPHMAALGDAYAAAGRYGEAEQWFDRIIAIEPGSSNSYYYYGDYYARKQLHHKAIEYFEKAARMKGTRSPSLDGNLAHEYFQVGQYVESAASARRALAQAPGNEVYEGILAEAVRRGRN